VAPRTNIAVKQINMKLNNAALNAAKAYLEIMAQEQAKRILQVTNQGKDLTGGNLKEYSPMYKAAIKKGLVRSSGGVRKASTKVNLRVGGDLMNSVKTRKSKDGAEIFFAGSHDTMSNAALAAKLLEKRPNWFGFSKEDIERITRKVQQYLKKNAKTFIDT